MKKLSVVTPVYNSPDSLKELYLEAKKTIISLNLDYEIIFVNDACPLNSWEIIKELCNKDKKIKGINLSRNFGQHRAILAGLFYVTGDYIIICDCDGQDPMDEIAKLYKKMQEGYEIVQGKREDRKDNLIKRLTSFLYISTFNYLADFKKEQGVANFAIYSRRAIEVIKSFKESQRSLIQELIGFKRAVILIQHNKRKYGKSAYNFSKSLSLALETIIAHSDKPLKLSIKFGFLISLFSLLYGVFIIIRYFISGISIVGWASLIVSIFFMFGLLFALLGILGLYIAKIFDEVKGRPLFIVDEVLN